MQTILNAPAFVIHVPELSPDRKDFFMKSITNAGFTNINIFKGITKPHDITESMVPEVDLLVADEEPSKGQFGCMLSHICLLKKIVNENIPLATIFEDDVWFHPQWKTLSEEYLKETPSDYDVLFIGNGLDGCINGQNKEKITKESTWCTHAYVVTQKGAQKFVNALIHWDYKSFNHASRGNTLTGLYVIDVMIKNTQQRILNKEIPELFVWYAWNGTIYPYKENLIPLEGNDRRNTGLVFQDVDSFTSTVSLNNYDDSIIVFSDEYENIIDLTTHETTEQWIAKTFIKPDAVVLELGGRCGVVSCTINRMLKTKTNQLVIEPDPLAFKALRKNMLRNNCKFKLFNGVISKKPLYFQANGLASVTRETACSCDTAPVPSKTLQQLVDETGLKFDTLVADCEGCLEMFFDENLDYLNNFKLITYENDCVEFCNYVKIEKMLIDHGFKQTRPGGHCVWENQNPVNLYQL